MKEKYESPEVEIVEIVGGGVDIIFVSVVGCTDAQNTAEC